MHPPQPRDVSHEHRRNSRATRRLFASCYRDFTQVWPGLARFAHGAATCGSLGRIRHASCDEAAPLAIDEPATTTGSTNVEDFTCPRRPDPTGRRETSSREEGSAVPSLIAPDRSCSTATERDQVRPAACAQVLQKTRPGFVPGFGDDPLEVRPRIHGPKSGLSLGMTALFLARCRCSRLLSREAISGLSAARLFRSPRSLARS